MSSCNSASDISPAHILSVQPPDPATDSENNSSNNNNKTILGAPEQPSTSPSPSLVAAFPTSSPDEFAEALSAFTHIVDCEYKPRSLGTACDESEFPCSCSYTHGVDPPYRACGEGSGCINRELFIECLDGFCPSGKWCQNRRLSLHQYAPTVVFRTAKKGYGVRAICDLEPRTLVREYVGEVIPREAFLKRTKLYQRDAHLHFYFMSLQREEIIDAQVKGSIARFVNHSCNPNCSTQKWIVGNRLRIGIYTTKNVSAGSELTFDYKFKCYGKKAQACYCGEPNCCGFIGQQAKKVRLDTDGRIIDPFTSLSGGEGEEDEDTDEEGADDDEDDDDGEFTTAHGNICDEFDGEADSAARRASNKGTCRNQRRGGRPKGTRIIQSGSGSRGFVRRPVKSIMQGELNSVVIALLRARDGEKLIGILLERLMKSELDVLKQFITMHGLKIMKNLLCMSLVESSSSSRGAGFGAGSSGSVLVENVQLLHKILVLLKSLPLRRRNTIDDLKLGELLISRCVNHDDLLVGDLSREILTAWDSLEVEYRIPKTDRRGTSVAESGSIALGAAGDAGAGAGAVVGASLGSSSTTPRSFAAYSERRAPQQSTPDCRSFSDRQSRDDDRTNASGRFFGANGSSANTWRSIGDSRRYDCSPKTSTVDARYVRSPRGYRDDHRPFDSRPSPSNGHWPYSSVSSFRREAEHFVWRPSSSLSRPFEPSRDQKDGGGNPSAAIVLADDDVRIEEPPPQSFSRGFGGDVGGVGVCGAGGGGSSNSHQGTRKNGTGPGCHQFLAGSGFVGATGLANSRPRGVATTPSRQTEPQKAAASLEVTDAMIQQIIEECSISAREHERKQAKLENVKDSRQHGQSGSVYQHHQHRQHLHQQSTRSRPASTSVSKTEVDDADTNANANESTNTKKNDNSIINRSSKDESDRRNMGECESAESLAAYLETGIKRSFGTAAICSCSSSGSSGGGGNSSNIDCGVDDMREQKSSRTGDKCGGEGHLKLDRRKNTASVTVRDTKDTERSSGGDGKVQQHRQHCHGPPPSSSSSSSSSSSGFDVCLFVRRYLSRNLDRDFESTDEFKAQVRIIMKTIQKKNLRVSGSMNVPAEGREAAMELAKSTIEWHMKAFRASKSKVAEGRKGGDVEPLPVVSQTAPEKPIFPSELVDL